MTRALIFLILLCLAPCMAQEWAAAKPGYSFQFPRDHGPHPEFKIEWWYFTGNVHTEKGRRLGYQLTFFRIGAVAKPQVVSPWALRDVWMAHLAVSDVEGNKYHHADRLNRAGPGMAGATTARIWNEDWSCIVGAAGAFELAAADTDFAIQLRLKDEHPPVIHGENGISQKGATVGNASHYYSLTRLATEGTLTLGKETLKVVGESWMDHEFGTSFLEKGQQGWDWFSAQLNDGSALMLFQLRGSGDVTAGTFIRPDGKALPLKRDDIRLKPLAKWQNYPVEWEIQIPAHQITLQCRAAMENQEFQAVATPGLNYWEGAVDYRGTAAGQAVSGQGYLEMTGYRGTAMSRWFGVGD